MLKYKIPIEHKILYQIHFGYYIYSSSRFRGIYRRIFGKDINGVPTEILMIFLRGEIGRFITYQTGGRCCVAKGGMGRPRKL